jgi:hypothetical protein
LFKKTGCSSLTSMFLLTKGSVNNERECQIFLLTKGVINWQLFSTKRKDSNLIGALENKRERG